jgi:uncharacterized coiled-coil DUF342 family protein
MTPEREKEIRDVLTKSGIRTIGNETFKYNDYGTQVVTELLEEIDRLRALNDKLSTDLVNREARLGQVEEESYRLVSSIQEALAKIRGDK